MLAQLLRSKQESACPDLMEKFQVIEGAKTLIFDRDGTINIDTGYTHKINEFEFTIEFLQIIKILENFEGNICIITNQGGVRLGKYLQSESREFTEHTVTQLNELGITISLVAACYHHNSDNCNYRKPAPGMLKTIEDIIGADKKSFLYIGNDHIDEIAAEDHGISYLDIKCENLGSKIVEWIDKS